MELNILSKMETDINDVNGERKPILPKDERSHCLQEFDEVDFAKTSSLPGTAEGKHEVDQGSIVKKIMEPTFRGQKPSLREIRPFTVGNLGVKRAVSVSDSSLSSGVSPTQSMFLDDDDNCIEIWEDADVAVEKLEVYKETVKDKMCDPNNMDNLHISQRSSSLIDQRHVRLGLELRHICRMGFVRRLGVVCSIIEEENLCLHHSAMVGDYGETGLHMAVLFDNTDCAKILLDKGGRDLVMSHYTHPIYKNTTVLHLAIAKQSVEVIRCILELLQEHENETFKLVNTEALGQHFEARLHTNGVPLALACCMGNTEIVNILVQFGAKFDGHDSKYGDTALHSLVKFSKNDPELACEMYDFIATNVHVEQWWKQRRNTLHRNDPRKYHRETVMKHLHEQTDNNHCTPLTVACHIDARMMISRILHTDEVFRFFQWSCGPTSISFYDITQVNSSHKLCGTGSSEPSVLEYLLYCGASTRLGCLDTEPFTTLLYSKWKSYRLLFYLWCVLHFVLMVACSTVAYIPSPQQQQDDIPRSVVVTFLDIFCLVSCVFYLLGEIYDFIICICVFLSAWKCRYKTPGWSSIFWAAFHSDFFRGILVIFSICGIAGSRQVTYLMGSGWPRDSCNAIMLIFGWVFLLFFTRAFQNIGIFAAMLQRIILGDLMHFSLIFIVILTGFTLSLRLLYRGCTDIPDEISTLGRTAVNLFRYMVGGTELEIAEDSDYSVMVYAVLVMFILIANIQLLNMLIAAMSDTYMTITGHKRLLWIRLRTQSVMLLERRLPRCMVGNMAHIHSRIKDGRQLQLLSVEEIPKDKDTK